MNYLACPTLMFRHPVAGDPFAATALVDARGRLDDLLLARGAYSWLGMMGRCRMFWSELMYKTFDPSEQYVKARP